LLSIYNILKYIINVTYPLDHVNAADFYIIGTPIFQSSITGVLKNIFDLVPVSMIVNKVMGFIATGGTNHHYLVVENQLKPIAGFFRAYVAPGHVYINDEHFNDQQQIANADIVTRIEKLADEVVFMQTRLKG
jgi:FAD reductase [NAD(P)H]